MNPTPEQIRAALDKIESVHQFLADEAINAIAHGEQYRATRIRTNAIELKQAHILLGGKESA